jgi:glycosyltransferase involved in cell wall biosynthesis
MLKTPTFRRLLARMLRSFSNGSGRFCLPGKKEETSFRRAMILTPGVIPTTEIYIQGLLEKRFGGAVAYVNTLEHSPREVQWQDASLVVVVRYAPLRWLFWLKRKRPRFAGIAFLMDDDMPAALQATELPLGYAVKTAWRYALTRRFLSRCCNELWVSTPELAKRYPSETRRVLEPGYVFPPSACGDQNVYFYHGTWAHRREIQWLVPIVRKVQQRLPDVWFEIMGTDRVWKMFRRIPRVRVVHPMTWENYRHYAASCSYRVGLAPCLDSVFNRARSHSKIFDITAAGAVGVYSEGQPYTGKIMHGRTGLLCKNDPDAWAAAILLLLTHREARAAIFETAHGWCAENTFADSARTAMAVN